MGKIISKKEVEKIAKLARLGLTPHEISQAAKDLEGVLGHFSKIQDIDTTNIPMSDDVTGLNNIVREDEVETDKICCVEELLEKASSIRDRQIEVKAVFE